MVVNQTTITTRNAAEEATGTIIDDEHAAQQQQAGLQVKHLFCWKDRALGRSPIPLVEHVT